MRIDLANKNAWFMQTDRCYYSDLPIAHQRTFTSDDSRSNFQADVAKLGSNIISVKPYGYASSVATSELLAFFDQYFSKYFEIEKGIIYIEDYAGLTGVNFESRRKYISYFKRNDSFLAVILYNLPLIYRISFNLFKKLNTDASRAYAVDKYEQAVNLAFEILGRTSPSDLRKTGNIVATGYRGKRSSLDRFSDQLSEKIERIISLFLKNQISRFKNRYSEEFLQHIASIDWKKPGFVPPDNKIFADISSKKLFDAFGFIKSEIDSLLEERTAADRILRESETKYRLLVEHAKAGIIEYDYDAKKIVSTNNAFMDITGYTKNELLSMTLTDLLDDEGGKNFKDRLLQLRAGEAISSDAVYRIITKKGDPRYVLANTNFTYQDGLPQKANIVATDITRLKTIEGELLEYQEKLKSLSIQLSMSEEEQRRNLASQFHDTISQELFVAQLQLDAFEKSLGNPTQIDEISKIKNHVTKLIKNMRDLIFDLSPPILYDFGFKETLETLSNLTESKYRVHVMTKFTGDMDLIDDKIKVIIYRSLKELIHNAVKHSHANNVGISIQNFQDKLRITVKDDGAGWDVKNYDSHSALPKGFGLFDIKEKMNHLGGELSIDSAPGKGASIYMEVPLKSLS